MKPFLVTCVVAAVPALACGAAHPATPASPPTSGTELHCPAALVQAAVADGVPDGWVLHAERGRVPLQRAAFYDGDPVGLGTLAPDTTHRNGLIETSTWHFDTTDSGRVWLGCLYRDAAAVIARPLPSGLHQCTTTLRLTALGEPAEALSVRCR
jgi:hypothetical protein